jgi:hypothetical protein
MADVLMGMMAIPIRTSTNFSNGPRTLNVAGLHDYHLVTSRRMELGNHNILNSAVFI